VRFYKTPGYNDMMSSEGTGTAAPFVTRPAVLLQARAQAINAKPMSLAMAATTKGELASSCDAIYCVAVLCRGYLTITGVQRSYPLLRFEDCELMVADFERCSKPVKSLLLCTTTFRSTDTVSAWDLDIVFEAESARQSLQARGGASQEVTF
jgi:hypothetical protein